MNGNLASGSVSYSEGSSDGGTRTKDLSVVVLVAGVGGDGPRWGELV